MTGEFAFIEALRAIATDPAARSLADDAAVLAFGSETLVLTMDTMVEGVHYLPTDPAQDVAWKLIAVNVSDLSAKGATPVGCLYSHALGDDAWDRAFLTGMDDASRHFAIPLLGGDTVCMPQGAPKSFSLTALGTGPKGWPVPSRNAAQIGDTVWVSGAIGDAGLGLQAARDTLRGAPDDLAAVIERYRRPTPQPNLGVALASLVNAMMDVSDGLLVDAARIASASNCAITIDADAVPLSAAHLALVGGGIDARLAAMTAGDDYELFFTAPAANTAAIHNTAIAHGCRVSAIGEITEGTGIALSHQGRPFPLPERLGYQH